MSGELNETTNVSGCTIMIRKNNYGRWCVYPSFHIREVADGLSDVECEALGRAMTRAADRARHLNDSEGTKFLFEGGATE